MSFGSSKQKQDQTSQTDPWGPAVPAIKSYLKQVMSVGNTAATPDQTAAFDQLKANASAGNPFEGSLTKAANDALGYDNSAQSDLVGNAYGALQDNLGSYASGEHLDPMSNPQMQAMLQTVGNDVQDRINRMFAGAGRDLSGSNQQAVARGVTAAQLPLLLNQYNQNQQNQIGAASTLFSAGTQTAGTQAQLDQILQNLRMSGVDLSKAAVDAQNYGPNAILNLEQQQQQLPYENLAMLGSLLLPIAGLGGTTNQQGESKGTQWGISLSDERAKENIEPVGELADGQPVYAFTYKDDPTQTTHVGLMAQNVEKTHPEAVHELPGGLKGVDYGEATKTAAKMVRAALAKRRAH
ncbi:tail fiber domain-containing protein [Filomicrobium sp.]|uniref:tail fiber domain-containing protein n=1 Tax=Filomicrobium sp. TaxID=2024831 RepID=UPI002589CA18|nr:tail fiber domain-containing protein [Filomicrobium sp.]MCV0371716.1 tail fiber domain-containing protein [Filomicrobium sp.]